MKCIKFKVRYLLGTTGFQTDLLKCEILTFVGIMQYFIFRNKVALTFIGQTVNLIEKRQNFLQANILNFCCSNAHLKPSKIISQTLGILRFKIN